MVSGNRSPKLFGNVLVLLLGIIILTNTANAALIDNINAYYKFNETSGLIALNANNSAVDALKINFTGGLGTVSGKFDFAFNVSNRNEQVAYNLSFSPASTNVPLTFCGWYNISSADTNDALYAMTDAGIGANFVSQFASTTLLNFDAYTGVSHLLQIDYTPYFNSWTYLCQIVNTSHNTLYINGQLNQTISMGGGTWTNVNRLYLGNDRITLQTRALNGYLDEIGIWNRSLTPAEINQLYSGGSGLQYPFPIINATGITISAPTNGSYVYSNNYQNTSMVINPTVSPANATATCYYNTTANITYTPITCGANNTVTLQNVFGRTTITVLVSDVNGNNITNTSIVTIHKNLIDTSVFETQAKSFALELWNISTAPSIATFIYGSNSYSGTITSLGNGKYNLSTSFDIPTGIQSRSLYWNFTTDAAYTSSTLSQSVSGIFFVPFNSTYNIAYLNITFKDETNGTTLSGLISASTWTYYLGNGTTTKSLTYSNLTSSTNYSFAFSPAWATMHHSSDISYYANGYPIRRLIDYDDDLTNSTTNKILYLLSSATGIYSSFQVTNTIGNSLPDVEVVIERQINSVWTIIETANTDSSGLVTFWVDPNSDYRVSASKIGYQTSTATVRPTQTLYTIVLSSASSNASFTSNLEGITWLFRPSVGQIVANRSINFNVTIQAAKSNLVTCMFRLANQTTNISTTTAGCAAGGGTLSITYTPQRNEKLKGILSVNVGGGFIQLDSDAYWVSYTNFTEVGTIKGILISMSNLNEFGEGVEQEFSKIVFFFISFSLVVGIITFFTGYDFANPGAATIFLYIVILLASLAGWFQFENLVGTSVFAPDSETQTFLNKYSYLIIISMFFVGFMANNWRKVNG
ncbi:MAG TPA: LamG-like jellyroll fold domain-containing protein [Allocoleopsis sp.]